MRAFAPCKCWKHRANSFDGGNYGFFSGMDGHHRFVVVGYPPYPFHSGKQLPHGGNFSLHALAVHIDVTVAATGIHLVRNIDCQPDW